jgi:2-keto-4-pentenoate hydratase/2-oxohepta-3-ene-1,7-dioic acid hydratase in catechol pathway
VLVAQTSAGVARVDNGHFELLDVGGATLSDLIKTGATNRLLQARVIANANGATMTVQAPIDRPGKTLIVGLNYLDHAAEIGAELPDVPRVHLVASSAVTAPLRDVVLPAIAGTRVDFEGEMAVVIGSIAKAVSKEDAWSHVVGITVANDITARDVQDGSNPYFSGANVGLAKSFDGFKPLGPALLMSHGADISQHLTLRTRVDGEVRQQSTTAKMHFSVAELVAQISQYTTLHPGDVILTGTPGGVGASDGRFLRPGQVVEVELETVGTLRSTFRSDGLTGASRQSSNSNMDPNSVHH